MTRGLNHWNKVFIFTGFSFECYATKKTIRENLKSIMSISMIFLNFCSSAVVFKLTKIEDGNKHVIRLLRLGLWSLCASSLAIMVLVVTKRSFEVNFWTKIKQIEIIFTYRLKINLEYEKFNKSAGREILISLLIFLSTQICSIIITAKYDFNQRVYLALIGSPTRMILRLLFTKFLFYIRVISFCLENLEKRLERRNLTVIEMKHLKKVYSMCWQLCNLVHGIFEWGLVFMAVTGYFGTVLSGYHIAIDFSSNKFNFGPIFRFICIVHPIYMVTMSCKKCEDSCRSIATAIFDLNSRDLHGTVEAFGQQLLHQKIQFKPLNLFVLDPSYAVSVIIDGKCGGKLMNFDLISGAFIDGFLQHCRAPVPLHIEWTCLRVLM
jgi:hypothetical protein